MLKNCHRGTIFNWYHIDNIDVIIFILICLHLSGNRTVSDFFFFSLPTHVTTYTCFRVNILFEFISIEIKQTYSLVKKQWI